MFSGLHTDCRAALDSVAQPYQSKVAPLPARLPIAATHYPSSICDFLKLESAHSSALLGPHIEQIIKQLGDRGTS